MGFYGLYFAFWTFIPVDPAHSYIGLPRASYELSAWISALGAATLVLSHRLASGRFRLPENRVLSILPRPSLLILAAVLWGVGIGATFLLMTKDILPGFIQVFALISRLHLLGMGLLFVLHLERPLAPAWRALLWGAVIPIPVILTMVTGFLAPILTLAAFLAMLYAGIRGRFPTQWFAVAILLLLPLLVFKGEYRRITWSDGSKVTSGVSDIPKQLHLFVSVVSELIATDPSEAFDEGLTIFAQRASIHDLFAFTVDQVPERNPFYYGLTYRDALWFFVPRLVYPAKPENNWGNQWGRDLGLLDQDDTFTSLNLPQMIEGYLNWGIAGVLIVMALIGAIWAFLDVKTNQPGVLDHWSFITGAVLATALLNLESNLTVVVGGVLQTAILFGLLRLMLHRFYSPHAGIIKAGFDPS